MKQLSRGFYIWGTGKIAAVFYECVEDSYLKGFIDNNIDKNGHIFNNKRVYSFDEIKGDFELIIVCVKEYGGIFLQLKGAEVDLKKVIFLYDSNDEEKIEKYSFINADRWALYRQKEINKELQLKIDNAVFEKMDEFNAGHWWFPKIESNELLVKKINNEKCSFIRFGDGEFEIISGRNRAPFQEVEGDLSERLKRVLQYDDNKLLIGISNLYGSLDEYTEVTARAMREYLTPERRKEHLMLLNKNKVYYNALIFKTYMPYKDRKKTEERIHLVKSIWERKNVVLIEGDKTRSGWKNDLFSNTSSIQRVIAPTKNAYTYYDEILSEAKKISKDKLILIALGPAGKVLGLDLYLEGYQVIDIGQLDMDYDWYKADIGLRVPNPYKYISQLPETAVSDVVDEEYEEQIIARINV